jgi:NAD(P)H-dependent flavin oxidoreductase YrpB (nitropropane dioxygenase family)
MRTTITEMFDIEFPLFAFSHCRDVVAAVTNAGGVGVLGAASHSAEQLELELSWIDEHVNGKPYGVDLVMPAKQIGRGEVDPLNYRAEFLAMIPAEHKAFVDELLEEHGVPELDTSDTVRIDASSLSHEGAERQLQVALGHPVSLLVNALGPMPESVVERARQQGIKTGALVGSAEHATKQVANGVDIIVAQGTEAGGHCGEISTMVLIPDVVDAVGQTPVLAAGGIGTGRQVAAALALGAAGVWTGSIWLTTAESDIADVLRENLLRAKSTDTVRSRAMTGKPARQLRTAWTEAWDSGRGPAPLPMPLQTMLYIPAKERIEHFNAGALSGEAVGQIVGRMSTSPSARDLVFNLQAETAEALDELQRVFDTAR